jgi:hypothetical protein
VQELRRVLRNKEEIFAMCHQQAVDALELALMRAINILPRWFNEKGKLSPEALTESYFHIFTYGLASR